MKQYTISYVFIEEDNTYMAMCPSIIGFRVYAGSLNELKEEAIGLLSSIKNENITETQLKFVEM